MGKILGLALGIVAVMSRNGFAYIDPGTGFAFASGIGAFVMGLVTLVGGTLALTFKKWTRALRSLFKGKSGQPGS